MAQSQNYISYNPVRIVFGAGRLSELPELTSSTRIALITTPGFTRRGITAKLISMFADRLIAIQDDVEPNPDMETLDAAAISLRDVNPDMIIALGGGSALDTGKILAKTVQAPDGWSLCDHFRNNLPLHDDTPLPVLAIPTTSGTGAEMTPFATVWDRQNLKKYSLADPDMFPKTALIDPEMTIEMPEEVTVSTGLDAVSQAIESIWNKSSNALSYGWAVQSLKLSLKSLPYVAANPTDIQARASMAEASMLAGLAISHTRTALAHSMSYPITAHHGLPHGLACSFTLPALLSFNAVADDGRLAETAHDLGFSSLNQLEEQFNDLLGLLKVPNYFKKYINDPYAVLNYVEEMITPGRADNNLRDASFDDVRSILNRSLKNLFA